MIKCQTCMNRASVILEDRVTKVWFPLTLCYDCMFSDPRNITLADLIQEESDDGRAS